MANKSHIQPITKLRIKGFKSIQDQTIPLNHANVLLGANGAGKTNLLSVFNLLGNVLRKGLSLSTVCMSLPQVFYQGEETTSSLEIEVFFANSTSYGFTLIPKNGLGLKIQQEYISKNGQYTYLQNANGAESVWETEVHEKHLYAILFDLSRVRCYDLSRISSKGDAVFSQIPNGDRVLYGGMGNLPSFLFLLEAKYPKEFKRIEQTISVVEPSFDGFCLKAETGSIDPHTVSLKWREKGTGAVLPPFYLSDGTLRFIGLMTLLMMPEDIRPSVILLDNPDLYLDDLSLNILGESLQGVQRTSPDTQIIVATHSTTLIDFFSPEDVVVVERGPKGSLFSKPDPIFCKGLLAENFSLGELWRKNVLGGHSRKAFPMQE